MLQQQNQYMPRNQAYSLQQQFPALTQQQSPFQGYGFRGGGVMGGGYGVVAGIGNTIQPPNPNPGMIAGGGMPNQGWLPPALRRPGYNYVEPPRRVPIGLDAGFQQMYAGGYQSQPRTPVANRINPLISPYMARQ